MRDPEGLRDRTGSESKMFCRTQALCVVPIRSLGSPPNNLLKAEPKGASNKRFRGRRILVKPEFLSRSQVVREKRIRGEKGGAAP